MSKWTQPGVLLLDKHSGVTSMKAVSQLKGKLKLHKVGHAGTLDPLATGLLICLLNGATRLAPYASAGQKRYTGIMSFGVESSTDDVDGSLSKRNVPPPALSVIRDMLTRFEGTIDQVPPQVSAVKVNGQKAYQRAR
ncbi:MAG: hypothetical protein KDD62_13435, partial [Bdellovibrionales bacterium]|nr:hypothetical protein [Bdellovibrionales bacterium]